MLLSLIQNEILYYDNTTKYQNWNITDFNSPGRTAPQIPPSTSTVSSKAIIDDSLLAVASAQLILHHENSSQVTAGSLTVGAILVDTRLYEYSLFAFNLPLILILIEEMFRTRCWANLPFFDYNDLIGVMVTSSELANQETTAHEKSDSIWVADPHDKCASGIRVELRCREDGSVGLVGVQTNEFGSVESVEGGSNMRFG